MAKRRQRDISSETTPFERKKWMIICASIVAVITLFYLGSTLNFRSWFQTKPETTNPVVKAALPKKTLPVKKHMRLPQIEILNGCGIEGITGYFKSALKEKDIDVIATGNYKNFEQTETFILVHDKKFLELASQLATQLGLAATHIKHEIKTKPLNELTLVLGSDFGKLNYKN